MSRPATTTDIGFDKDSSTGKRTLGIRSSMDSKPITRALRSSAVILTFYIENEI